jgi:hypothetical protein
MGSYAHRIIKSQSNCHCKTFPQVKARIALAIIHAVVLARKMSLWPKKILENYCKLTKLTLCFEEV